MTKLPQRVLGCPNGFDYAKVKPSVAVFLKGQADRIRKHLALSVIQVGKALLESKRHLSHGTFLSWVEHEMGIPPRTAQDYMRVAAWAKGKSATVAHLPPSVLYMLSKASAPEEVVVEVLNLAEAGERVTPSAVRSRLKTLRSCEPVNSHRTETKSGEIYAALSTDSIDEVPDLIAELVAILNQGLSEADFVRVRDIMTTEALFVDMRLVQRLRTELGKVISIGADTHKDFHFVEVCNSGSIKVFDNGSLTTNGV